MWYHKIQEKNSVNLPDTRVTYILLNVFVHIILMIYNKK
jgi:hypothetical protein